jgi:hypothetical protein
MGSEWGDISWESITKIYNYDEWEFETCPRNCGPGVETTWLVHVGTIDWSCLI